MGICDLIPGISGGTIAFITGIYDKLIYSISSISIQMFLDAIKYIKNKNPENEKKIREDFKKVDLYFLLTLGLGIGTAILLGSKIIKFLMQNYFTYTIAFFSGLIIASSKIIYHGIQNHKTKNIFFCLIGFLIGASFVLLINITERIPNKKSTTKITVFSVVH